jgi:malyl-CoA/(S)-citramalyl-CoA lyase
MSNWGQEAARIAYRSLLMVPGSKPELFAKAAAGPADAICLDLEDSVVPAQKDAARAEIIRALREVDFGAKVLLCRINALDTPWWYRDIIELAEQGGDRLDIIMVPKVECGGDLHAADLLAQQAARSGGRTRPILLDVQAETARGLMKLEEIAAASPRLTAIHFGHADFAASMQMRTTEIGADSPDYAVTADAASGSTPGDAWHYAMTRVVMIARAHGLMPVAGPFGKYADLATLAVIARRHAYMGFAAKWAIHPGQVEPINEAFSPTDAEIARSKELLRLVEEAQAKGLGAFSQAGVLVDAVSVRQARQILRLARKD